MPVSSGNLAALLAQLRELHGGRVAPGLGEYAGAAAIPSPVRPGMGGGLATGMGPEAYLRSGLHMPGSPAAAVAPGAATGAAGAVGAGKGAWPAIANVRKVLGEKAAGVYEQVRGATGAGGGTIAGKPTSWGNIKKFATGPWLLITIGLLAAQSAVSQWLDYEQSKKLPELGKSRGRLEGLLAAGGGEETLASQRLGKEAGMNMQAFQQAMQTLVPAAMSLPPEKLEAVLGGGGGTDFRIPLD